MKVLIDTSAWVDFLNGHASTEADAVADLIAGEDELCTCGVIVAEIFQGLRRDKNRGALESQFRRMSFLEPSGFDVYLRAAEIHRLLRKRGKTVRSTIDCLIAALAEENGCYILARDMDLSTIVDSGLVKVGLWPTRNYPS
jgi:predicted nucleic acid-binding protein